jgi:hypothetical protein
METHEAVAVLFKADTERRFRWTPERDRALLVLVARMSYRAIARATGLHKDVANRRKARLVPAVARVVAAGPGRAVVEDAGPANEDGMVPVRVRAWVESGSALSKAA